MASTSESDSSVDRRIVGDSFVRSLNKAEPGASQIWLDGDVLACACPECGAPMSIRVWLSIAECRMCATVVELTEEQELLAKQLLEAREAAQEKKHAPPASTPAWANPVERNVPAPKLKPVEILTPPPVPSPPRPASSVPKPLRRPTPAEPVRRAMPRQPQPLIAQVVDDRPKLLVARPADALPEPTPPDADKSGLLGRSWLQQLISALMSLLVNMLIIILLGLFQFQMPAKPRVLVFEVDLKPEAAGRVGSEVKVKELKKEPAVKKPEPKEPIQPVKQEKPLAPPALPPMETKKLVEKLITPPFETAPPPNMPSSTSSASGGNPAAGTLLAGRDQSVRAKILNIEGGTERTEIAVAMGLKWIASHQNRDGSWSLEGFDLAGECRGRCDHFGTQSDTAGTALALLPFLGAGYTQKGNHEYRETVEKGLEWLVANQGTDGDLRGQGQGRMYAHGQAAIALCEAYALTRDSKLKDPAQRAIDFIVKAQHYQGGWRYRPDEPGDTSVVGWQIMALRSAQMAGLNVPMATFNKSDDFLASVQSSPSEGKFCYMPRFRPSEVMTAEGLLCRLYSGWRTNAPPLLHGVDWLLGSHLPKEDRLNMYYIYYATQVMHHVGGDRWNKWNERMKRVLVETQVKEGHMTGSWTPTDSHDRIGGRLYMTALAVCTLEVYYRHLPIYKNAVTQQTK